MIVDFSLALPTLTLISGGVAVLLGLTIVRENPRQKLNWVLGSMLFLGSVGAVFGAIDFTVSREEPKLLEAEAGLLSTFASLWELIFPTFLLFALLYPRDRTIVRRLPYIQWLLFLPYVIHLVLALAGSPDEGGWGLENVSTGHLWLDRAIQVLDLGLDLIYAANAELFSLVNLTYMILAIAWLRSAARKALNPRLRAQISVMVGGMGGSFALYAVAQPIPELIGIDVDPVVRIGLTVAALAAASLSIAYSIVRYRFLDAKVIARRSILFGAVSGLALGVYIALIHRINLVVAGLLGIEARILETAMLVVGLLVFHPIAGRIEEWLEGLLIRDRADYRTMLRRLAREVSTVLNLDELSQRVVEMLETSLMVDRAMLLVRRTPDGALSAVAGFGTEDLATEWVGELEHGDYTSLELPYLQEALVNSDGMLPREVASMLAVPLVHRGDLLGLLLMGAKLTGAGYHSEDRSLLAALGDQLGVAIRNTLLHRESIARSVLEEELRFARRVQQSFMPTELPEVPPIQVSALNVPSKQVGGDYVDALKIGADEVMVAIGDVSGKGVPAALLMSMTRAALRTQAVSLHSPGDILRSMNSLIHESTSPREFVTFFLACIDRRSLTVTYSNGGHDRPLLRRRNGTIEQLGQGGMLLGAVPETTFVEGILDLAAGDLLILYTDGLTEAHRDGDQEGEMFGTDRLEECVAGIDPDLTAREVLDTLVGKCRSWTGAGELSDDMTLLVLRVLDGQAA